MKVISWTNPASGTAAKNQSLGFEPSEATITNITTGVQSYWNSAMTDGYYLTVSTGAVTTSNGFTPISQDTLVGAPITGITLANPCVVSASYLSQFSFAVGDTVNLRGVATDSATSGDASLNITSTVTAFDATTVTLALDTSADYAAYVSDGWIVRTIDSDSIPVPTYNHAIQGLTFGTGVVGTDSDVLTAVIHGDNPVV